MRAKNTSFHELDHGCVPPTTLARTVSPCTAPNQSNRQISPSHGDVAQPRPESTGNDRGTSLCSVPSLHWLPLSLGLGFDIERIVPCPAQFPIRSMADSPPRVAQGTVETRIDAENAAIAGTEMNGGKKPIASRRGTKLLAIPLPRRLSHDRNISSSGSSSTKLPSSLSDSAFHRSSKTPGASFGGSYTTSSNAAHSAAEGDVAVVLTPKFPSTPQPRVKPHYGATAAAHHLSPLHPPPTDSDGAQGQLPSSRVHEAPSKAAAAGAVPSTASQLLRHSRPPRQAPHSPRSKVQWRCFAAMEAALLTAALFLLSIPTLWIGSRRFWQTPSRLSQTSLNIVAVAAVADSPISIAPQPFRHPDRGSGGVLPPRDEKGRDLPLSHLRRHVRSDFFAPRVGKSESSRLSLLPSWLRGLKARRPNGEGVRGMLHQKGEQNAGAVGGREAAGEAGTAVAAGSEGSPQRGGSRAGNEEQQQGGGAEQRDGICVAIPSSPRAFPHHEHTPWHFPVSLLKLLNERHSSSQRTSRSARGGKRGGLGKMRAVVYSAGCETPVPAAQAANRRLRMDASGRVREPMTVEDLEADFVADETKRTNEMLVGYTREIERAAKGLSMRVDVLRAHEDVCRFIGQEEGELKSGGVEEKVVGRDGWQVWKWRTKLVMDFVYVAKQCLATRPKYVLLLQDDTLPVKSYDVGIERFVNEDLSDKSWGVLSLYNPQSYNWKYQHGDEYLIPCCAQALLFNVTALEGLLEYMEEHFTETNMDLLVNKYLVESGTKGYVHVPSLFQHLGEVRTKDSGIGRPEIVHVDKQFDENIVVG